ncbi:MAG: DUF1223 domain-containing protein [Pseudomonadota bacterium]|nr:DUF1223 domain-containing protein [Pseudomonadota bacterium]
MTIRRDVTTGIALIAGLAAAASGPAAAASADQPIVVELFQSQGCSSCPPANAMLNRLAERADLLPLNFGVTYWDRLGWKDKFAHPDYTERQWDYARSGGRHNVATPQFIINGRGVVTGSDARQLARTIRAANGKETGPMITVDGKRVRIAAGRAAAPATVWLVRYDPRVRNVSIGRGENEGRVLPHRNVVTGLRSLGTWTGLAAMFDQPAYRDAGERSAILIQQGKGGPIIAAKRI